VNEISRTHEKQPDNFPLGKLGAKTQQCDKTTPAMPPKRSRKEILEQWNEEKAKKKGCVEWQWQQDQSLRSCHPKNLDFFS
jgi:hypothetical protein